MQTLTMEQPQGRLRAAELQKRIDAVGAPLVPRFIKYLNTNKKDEELTAAGQAYTYRNGRSRFGASRQD